MSAPARYDAIPSSDGSHTVKARFLCSHDKKNRMLYDFLSTARLAGVPVEVVGLGWDSFSSVDRQWFLVDYADAEHLSDEDVVVQFDSDMLFTGEDLYPAIAEFVAKSPANASQTDPLMVRLNEQVAPVLFSSENNCVRHQMNSDHLCVSDFDDLDSLYASWSESSSLNKTFIPNTKGRRNPQRFLNCGFVMGRVWALRLLRNAFSYYAYHNPPPDGSGKWVVDQGIYANFFLNLSRWEVNSGLLSQKREDRLGKPGPLGMVGGMLGMDYQQNYTAAIHGGNVGLLHLNEKHFPHDTFCNFRTYINQFFVDVIKELRNGTIPCNTTATGAAIMGQSLSYYPHKTNYTVVGEEYWGVPVFDDTTPPLWHFCGPEKTTKLPAFGALLPSLIVMEVFPWEEEVSSRVFWSAEPTRVWSVVPAISRPLMPLTIVRSSINDITSEELCRFG